MRRLALLAVKRGGERQNMTLHKPFYISSRLMSALNVGGADIALQEYGVSSDGRTVWNWVIDLPDGQTFSGHDLKSGVGGGTLQEGFASLLSFLSAFAEARKYQERTERESENADLFPEGLALWAMQHSDEITMLQMEIEESDKALIEE